LDKFAVGERRRAHGRDHQVAARRPRRRRL